MTRQDILDGLKPSEKDITGRPSEDTLKRAKSDVVFSGQSIDQRAAELERARGHVKECEHRLAVEHERLKDAIERLSVLFEWAAAP